jgi:hypothetical protein
MKTTHKREIEVTALQWKGGNLDEFEKSFEDYSFRKHNDGRLLVDEKQESGWQGVYQIKLYDWLTTMDFEMSFSSLNTMSNEDFQKTYTPINKEQ